MTELIYFIRSGQSYNAIQHIKNRGDVNSKNSYGDQPILEAVRYNRYNVFKTLINSKNFCDYTPLHSYYWSLLMIACQGGQCNMIKLLIDSPKINEKINHCGRLNFGPNNITALELATLCNHPSAVKLLINTGRLEGSINRQGYRSILNAVQNNNVLMVKELLHWYGCYFTYVEFENILQKFEFDWNFKMKKIFIDYQTAIMKIQRAWKRHKHSRKLYATIYIQYWWRHHHYKPGGYGSKNAFQNFNTLLLKETINKT